MAVTISGSTPTFSAATGYAGGTITSGTSITTTSGTTADFTSIPSWAKKITVMFNGVSTTGTSGYLVQLGTSGGIVATGYSAGSSSGQSTLASTAYTTGFGIRSGSATDTCYGHVVITNVTGNIWVSSHAIGLPAPAFIMGGGGISLAGVLTTVRVTSGNGTDTFDAGSINILYE